MYAHSFILIFPIASMQQQQPQAEPIPTTTSSSANQEIKKKKPRLKRCVNILPSSTLRNREDEETTLKVCRHSEHAKLPTQGSFVAAGCDLYAAENVVIEPCKNGTISTDISIVSFPTNCYGRIAGRSGLAMHHNIMVGGGVIDRDYTGIIKVILFNCGESPFIVSIGDRIAQLICEVYRQVHVKPIISFNHPPPDTDDENANVCAGPAAQLIPLGVRGANGFGSTGR